MDCYHFLNFRLNKVSESLYYRGVEKKLPVKSIRLLAILLDKPGVTVDTSVLCKHLWPNHSADNDSLSRLVTETRKLLGRSVSGPDFVQTVGDRGYRFNPAIPVQSTIPAHAKADSFASKLLSYFQFSLNHQ